jgi:hypothetical protein
MVIIGLGIVWYAVVWLRSSRAVSELTGGTWLVVYLVGLTLLSALGSFGGAHVLPAPWDSVAVAAFSLATYVWGCRSGTEYMTARPEMVARLRADADQDRGDAPEEALA